MKECGYRLTREYAIERTETYDVPTHPSGKGFDSDSLALLYEKLGLTPERERPDDPVDKGRVNPGSCAICGKFVKGNVKVVACDPEKHTAYYDALEIR
jgi:hypothetical protein